MNISIIFHDLDGCLNPSDGEDFGSGTEAHLSAQQCDTLKRLGDAIENSTLEHFVINTGRGIADTFFIAEKIPTQKLRYCLLEHSGYAWDMVKNKRIDLNAMALKLGQNDYVRKYKGMVNIHQLLDWFLEDGAIEYEEEFGLKFEFLEKDSNLSILTPPGVRPETMIHNLKDFIDRQYPNNQFIYCYSHAYIDVLCDIHKSDGAKLLCKDLGIAEDQALIVGDGMNDLDIFNKFSTLLCPNNAHPDLQKLCLQNGGIVSDFKYADATFDILNRIN
jgi:hydroxymethylpyrimidine pyrophosphatase-like HAD family hydrolase